MRTFKTKFPKPSLPKEQRKKSVLVTEAIQSPKEKLSRLSIVRRSI